jgi:hypothetical protein
LSEATKLSRIAAHNLCGSGWSLLEVMNETDGDITNRYDDMELEGILDKRLTQASCRRASVAEVMAIAEGYRKKHMGWNVKH